jgi:hypothetical protein
MTTLRNITLFVAAPFVALAYVIAFPFVGLVMLAWFAARAAAKHPAVRTAGLIVGAPLIALAYVVLFPFVGLALLAWIGGRALMAREPEEPEYRLAAAA